MLLSEQQPICQQTCAAGQRALGRHPRKLRKIVAFRQMRQNDVGSLSIVFILKVSGCGLV